jgi:hypothetical protein
MLRIRARITPAPNFANEFNIFGAIKNDSIGSGAEGSAQGGAFEVPFGGGICGPGVEALSPRARES